jgi:hypothetical protein
MSDNMDNTNDVNVLKKLEEKLFAYNELLLDKNVNNKEFKKQRDEIVKKRNMIQEILYPDRGEFASKMIRFLKDREFGDYKYVVLPDINYELGAFLVLEGHELALDENGLIPKEAGDVVDIRESDAEYDSKNGQDQVIYLGQTSEGTEIDLTDFYDQIKSEFTTYTPELRGIMEEYVYLVLNDNMKKQSRLLEKEER